MYSRILSSPPDSLLHESYKALRRVSNIYHIKKYSWCIQLCGLLDTIGYSDIMNNDCANSLLSHRNAINRKLRQDLGEAGLNRARVSKSIPHYYPLLSNDFMGEN